MSEEIVTKVHVCDVTRNDKVRETVEYIASVFGGIDVLVFAVGQVLTISKKRKVDIQGHVFEFSGNSEFISHGKYDATELLQCSLYCSSFPSIFTEIWVRTNYHSFINCR